MKKAVIIVGSHHTGKSLTINVHLKPKLGIGNDDRKFILNGKNGYILSQSFEESVRDFLDHSARYFRYDLLVFAARPETEPDSKFKLIHDALVKASYGVNTVSISDKSEAPSKAVEIFNLLSSN